MIPRSWNHIIGQIISWSRGISLLDVMNIWLQPFTPQVFKVMPQDAWMPIPRVVTPNIHWYWFLVLGIRTPKHHTGDNTHWPTKLDTVDKTSVQRRFFGCNCAARFVLKSNWKKGEKRHIRARNMIFLGLVFSGRQSLVIRGVTDANDTKSLDERHHQTGGGGAGKFGHRGLFQKKSLG